MKNIKKILAMLLTATMTLGMVTGCGGEKAETPSTGETPSAEETTEEGGTLTLMVQASDDVRISILEDYIQKNFAETFPGWELEVSTIDSGDAGVSTMKTYNATGDLPDVYWSDARWSQPMISAGNQLELSEYINSDGFADKFGGDTSIMSFKDGIYALQPGSDAAYFPVIFYDTEIFAEYDLEVPTTMDELYAVCDKLVAAGIQPFSIEGSGWDLMYTWFQNVLMSVDPSKVDALIAQEIDYSDPAVLEAVEILETMIEKGYFGERMSASAVLPAEARENFIAKKTAMRHDYYWQWSIYDDGKTDAFAFPNGNHGQMWGTTIAGYAVFSGSEHVDMAVKFAEYCCEQEALYHNEHGTSTVFDTGIEVKAGSDLQQKLNDMYKSFDDKRVTLVSNTMDAAVLAEMKTLFSSLLVGQTTAPEMLEEFNTVYAGNTYFD